MQSTVGKCSLGIVPDYQANGDDKSVLLPYETALREEADT